MEGIFENLTSSLNDEFSFTTQSTNVSINIKDVLQIFWSCTAYDNYVASIPVALRDFFKHYYEAIKTNEIITFNESDILTSEHSVFFKLYLRILEKLLFDYCLFKGLNFSDYEIEKEIHFYEDFRSVSFRYTESMNMFYFVMFLSMDANAHAVDCDLFNEKQDTIANGLPVIIPHAPNAYFNLSEKSVPAMIVKVRGA